MVVEMWAEKMSLFCREGWRSNIKAITLLWCCAVFLFLTSAHKHVKCECLRSLIIQDSLVPDISIPAHISISSQQVQIGDVLFDSCSPGWNSNRANQNFVGGIKNKDVIFQQQSHKKMATSVDETDSYTSCCKSTHRNK